MYSTFPELCAGLHDCWGQRVFGLGASTSPPFLLFLHHLEPIGLLSWCISGMEAILVPRGP